MRIFISYKRRDEAFALQLHDHITSWGYHAWLDVKEIKAGEEWDTAIHKGLRDASIVLGLLTPESIASDNVLDEWAYALSTGKRLFLLWMRDIEEVNVPPRYIRLQRIDMRYDVDAGLERLRQALETDAKILPSMEASAGQGGGMVVSAPASVAVPPKTEQRDDMSESTIRRRGTNRHNMLHKVKNFWIDGVLDQSIHGAVLIELGIEQDNENVENPWETVLKHQSYGDYQLPTSANIADIFDELGKEMLILGDPGSGKTTTLLTLARDLIDKAAKDDSLPIPVVFNLSSWADERKSLAEWLVDELNTKYQVPRPTAKDWVQHDDLLLLLDGLDEVDIRYRDMCVVAINKFRSEHGFTSIAVCSRILDYEALSNRLRLNGAIALQPLDAEQIDKYLSSLGDQMSGIRDAMQNDASLRTLAESPLMLSIMTLAFYGMSSEDLPLLDTVEAQRERLFETYTRRMFDRRPLAKDQKVKSWNPIVHLFGIGKYSKSDILHYLRWLAARMVERKQSVFYIENLQPDWIASERSRTFFRFFGRMSFGMVCAILITLFVFAAVFGFAIYQGTMADQGIQSIYDNSDYVRSTSSSSADVDGLRVIAGITSISMIVLMVGAAILSVNGMLDHARATLPIAIRPVHHLLWYFVKMTLIAFGIGLFYSLIFSGLALLYMYASEAYFDSYFWWALFISSLVGSGLAALIGAICALVALIMLPYTAEELFIFDEEYTLPSGADAHEQARKHTSGQVTVGYVATVMISGMLIAVITLLVIFLVGVSYQLYEYGEIYIFDSAFITDYIAIALSSTVPTLIFAMVIAYFGRRFVKTIPYVIATTSLSTYVIALFCAALIGSIVNGGATFIWWSVPILIIVFIVSTLIAGAIGVLFSLIRETIEISEALQWKWNWQAAIVALIVCIIFSGFAVFQPFVEWWQYPNRQVSPEREAQLFETYRERIDIINQNRVMVNNLYGDLDAMLREIRRSDDPGVEMSVSYFEHTPNDIEAVACQRHRTQMPISSMNEFPSFYAWQTELNSSSLTYRMSSEVDEDALEETFLNIALCEGLIADLKTLNNDDAGMIRSVIRQDIVLSMAFVATISLSIVIGAGVVGGIRRTEVVEVRTEPNSGIRQSRKTAVRVVAILAVVGMIIGIICGSVLQYISGLDTIYYSSVSYIISWHEWVLAASIATSVALGAIIGLFVGGGDAVVKHIVLRALLLWGGSIPFNYARLLNAASERVLLRKVGGGYIFIHRYLLEYFASQEYRERKSAED